MYNFFRRNNKWRTFIITTPFAKTKYQLIYITCEGALFRKVVIFSWRCILSNSTHVLSVTLSVGIRNLSSKSINLEKNGTLNQLKNFYKIKSRVFTNGPGDRVSIPGRVVPKTQKMVFDGALLNTQHYKVRINGKVEQSRKWSSPLLCTSVW